MMRRRHWFKVGLIALAASVLPVQAGSQQPQPDVILLENDFRGDFLSFEDEIDPNAVGSISRRDETFRYCLNISDKAKEARNAVLTKRLQEMEAVIDSKLDKMAEMIVELRSWTEKRESFLERANDSLVEIFQSMRADAAAMQLTEVGPIMAASIIAKLEPKISSAILAEMKPDDAANITMVLTSSMETDAKQ